MQYQSAIVSLAVVLLLVVGGVQLLDPELDERRPPEVDFSEPPAEVAADSAARFAFVDYAYRIDIADDRSGPWEQVRAVRIDHGDREYWKVGPLGRRGVILYGTDAAVFARPGSEGAWRLAADPDAAYPVPTLSQPFLVERLDASNAYVEVDNQTTFVVHVESNPLKLVEAYRGNATISVNKTTRTIETVLVAYDTGPGGIRYLRFQLTGTDPPVERPDDLPVSPREVVWDLLRGPLFRPFASASP